MRNRRGGRRHEYISLRSILFRLLDKFLPVRSEEVCQQLSQRDWMVVQRTLRRIFSNFVLQTCPNPKLVEEYGAEGEISEYTSLCPLSPMRPAYAFPF